jgi:hypothetical protein
MLILNLEVCKENLELLPYKIEIETMKRSCDVQPSHPWLSPENLFTDSKPVSYFRCFPIHRY